MRNLLAAAERKAGKQEDLWDCLDDKGELAPPGNYTIKGLYHDGLHVSYVMSFASPGQPGWQTADGKGAYYGDHTPPSAAAMAEDAGALACPMGEAGQHLIGVDLQGRRQWGLANRMFGVSDRISLATDGKILWIASSEGAGRFFIWRCDLKTGAYAPWQRQDKDGKAVLDLIIREKDGGANCRGIAWRAGVLAVILAAERKILLLDAETGDTRKELAEMPENMEACAFLADGRLALVAGDKLLLVDCETGKAQTAVEGLDSPQGIAVDKDGNFYVSQRGAKMCVEVFGGDGKKIRTIGKIGGRPAVGFFDASGMLMPAQIAIDGKGRLWVPESDCQPKRTSVWNISDGSLAFDLVGTTAYAAGGQINPFDPSRGYSERVEYKIDLEKQTWQPIFAFPDALGTGFEWIAKIARVNGREYIQCRGT
ncbi:MAG: hypothetical protein N3A66_10605, partial [Planctomycetota bacterium]|nr:hypothetical protein [Planctomycetota bacterium]